MSGVAVLLLIATAIAVPGQAVPGQPDRASGDPVEAVAQARAAVERAPSEFAPALALARALTALGRADEALAAFARARSLRPESTAGGEASGSVQLASAYLAPALLLRDLDRSGEAIRLLEEAVDRRVGRVEVYEQLALLRLADGMADQALAAVDAAAAEALESPGLGFARGLALARDPERREEALVMLERALEGGVEDPLIVHFEVADILTGQGRYAEALVHLRVAEGLAEDDPEVHYRLGRTLAAAEEPERAAVALERYRSLQAARDSAAEEARSEAAARAGGLAEAQRLAAAGDLEGALKRLGGLLEDRSPERTRVGDVHSLRSKVLFSMGRAGEAAKAAAEARRLQPDRVEHHYLEGLFLHTDGRPGEAAVALERGLALDPDLGEAHALLGMIAAEDGRSAEAADRMERAVQLGLDGNAALRFNYARVLRSLGRYEEAVAQMEAFERLRATTAPP